MRKTFISLLSIALTTLVVTAICFAGIFDTKNSEIEKIVRETFAARSLNNLKTTYDFKDGDLSVKIHSLKMERINKKEVLGETHYFATAHVKMTLYANKDIKRWDGTGYLHKGKVTDGLMKIDCEIVEDGFGRMRATGADITNPGKR